MNPPIGSRVVVPYDGRLISGELLGAASQDAAYVRIPINASRHRIIVVPSTLLQTDSRRDDAPGPAGRG